MYLLHDKFRFIDQCLCFFEISVILSTIVETIIKKVDKMQDFGWPDTSNFVEIIGKVCLLLNKNFLPSKPISGETFSLLNFLFY